MTSAASSAERPFGPGRRLRRSSAAVARQAVHVRPARRARRRRRFSRPGALPRSRDPRLGPRPHRGSAGTDARVKKVVSPVRFFDERRLELFRWVSERYVAPLAAVIARAVPPRVASEEAGWDRRKIESARARGGSCCGTSVLAAYRGAERSARGDRPGDRRVRRAARSRRRAGVGGRRGGRVSRRRPPGDRRRPRGGSRTGDGVRAARRVRRPCCAVPRRWQALAVPVVAGDRRGPLRRGDRDAARGVRAGGRAGAHLPREGEPSRASGGPGSVLPRPRRRARAGPTRGSRLRARGRVPVGGGGRARAARRWSPPHDAGRRRGRAAGTRGTRAEARQGPRDDSPRVRLLTAPRATGWLRSAGRAASRRPARRAAGCSAPPTGAVTCVVCGAAGRCRSCGGDVLRGPARRRRGRGGVGGPSRPRPGPAAPRQTSPPACPGGTRSWSAGRTTSGTSVPGDLDLVAILDVDLADRRPGLAARERSLATWMEAVGWARPRGTGDRAGVDARAIRSCRPSSAGTRIGSTPTRCERRHEAGLPVGAAVFRVTGAADLEAELRAFDPSTLLVSASEGRTVCLLALDPERVRALGTRLRELAADGVVDRVEAEPHL